MGELFGEGAVLAIGEIFEAKVLVELKEGLMLPGEFEVGLGGGEGAEEAFTATFDLLVGSGGTDVGKFFPTTGVEREEGVDEEFLES